MLQLHQPQTNMKNHFKSLQILSILLFAITLTACSSKQEKAPMVFSYTLDEETFSERGTDIPYSPQGLIGVPSIENAPVVFLLHGRHPLRDDIETPYYEGLSYLVENLAQNGYLAISININRAYSFEPIEGNEYYRTKEIFLKHYELLTDANNGKNIFPYSIKGKADLTKINLIGHSRGGELITALSSDSQLRNIPFVSAIKVASSNDMGYSKSYSDIPTALVLPQYDGDITSLDSVGQYYFEQNYDIARRTPIMYTYLYGADHNSFNTNVLEKDPITLENVIYLDKTKQQQFLKDFTTTFLNIYNKESTNLIETFNNFESSYKDYYMSGIFDPNSQKIIIPDSANLSDFIINGINIEYVLSNSLDKKNTAGAFNPPGINVNLPLYKISWDNNIGSITIPIDSIFYNITKDSILSFYLALDSSDIRNVQDIDTSFNIVFTDVNNSTHEVSLSSSTTNALKYQKGEIDTEFTNRLNTFTPLGTEFIYLDSFPESFMCDQIVSITIVPKSKTGTIMLGESAVYN